MECINMSIVRVINAVRNIINKIWGTAKLTKVMANSNYVENNFYEVMKKKYEHEDHELIDNAWVKVSAYLGSNGLTVYTKNGQRIIEAYYLGRFKY